MFDKQKFPIVGKNSLSKVARSHSLRCDSKQSERRFDELNSLLDSQETVFLSEFLPNTLIKGPQHIYQQEEQGIPVINTLSIQNMTINIEACRLISEDDFSGLDDSKILRSSDVLLTMDGGSSIGKPALFNLRGKYTVDSHVAILRPQNITPNSLVFLLASPIMQLQFQQFESGASGQTAVTEEDIRRFRVPLKAIQKLEDYVDELLIERTRIETERSELLLQEKQMWAQFTQKVIND